MTGAGQSPEPTLKLHTPRKRTIRYLILALVFVACGILMLPQNPWLAWIAIGFFGLGVVVFAIQIVRPSVLFLDADGFEPYVLLSRPGSRRQWDERSLFSVT